MYIRATQGPFLCIFVKYLDTFTSVCIHRNFSKSKTNFKKPVLVLSPDFSSPSLEESGLPLPSPQGHRIFSEGRRLCARS